MAINNPVSRRKLTNVIEIAGKAWNTVSYEVQDIIRKLVESQQLGIPGGFKASTPTTITADTTASAGTEFASWMAADATFDVATGPASDVRGKTYEGTDPNLARADHGHRTFTDPYRLVIG
jgi:hypothetical protein